MTHRLRDSEKEVLNCAIDLAELENALSHGFAVQRKINIAYEKLMRACDKLVEDLEGYKYYY